MGILKFHVIWVIENAQLIEVLTWTLTWHQWIVNWPNLFFTEICLKIFCRPKRVSENLVPKLRYLLQLCMNNSNAQTTSTAYLRNKNLGVIFFQSYWQILPCPGSVVILQSWEQQIEIMRVFDISFFFTLVTNEISRDEIYEICIVWCLSNDH